MPNDTTLEGRLARSVSVLFKTPGKLHTDELPPWFEIKPPKYEDTRKKSPTNYHQISHEDKASLRELLGKSGLSLVSVSAREKIGTKGVRTRTNFRFASNGKTNMNAAELDEALRVFDYMLKINWRSLGCLRQETDSPIYTIMMS
jgi:hypothetical protein